MPVTEINGYVLLPDPIDWSTLPAWSRGWQTGVTTALTGDETRQSVRSLGRDTLSWVISALTLPARAEMDERLDQASKLGLVCAPYWGRGSTLADPVNESADVILTDNSWPFAAGDYVFFMDAFGNWETAQIESVAPIVLTAPVAGSYAAGLLIWPLIFGKFSMDKQTAVTSWHGDVKVTLSELNARHQTHVGNAPEIGNGIGVMAIGSTFIIG